MSTGPKTTWEELATLGWPKQKVYDLVNEMRDGTMHGFDDIALNQSFCNDHQWFCYNAIKGRYNSEPVLDTYETSTVIREYDNTNNDQAYEETWLESWSETQSASLAITVGASIKLERSLRFQDVVSTDLSIVIDTESTGSKSDALKREFAFEWTLSVGPFESLSLVRVSVITNGTQVYNVKYGLNGRDDWIGTKGDKYIDRFAWARSANDILDEPSGTMQFTGNSMCTSYHFDLLRTKQDGRVVVEPLPLPEGASQKNHMKWAKAGPIAHKS